MNVLKLVERDGTSYFEVYKSKKQDQERVNQLHRRRNKSISTTRYGAYNIFVLADIKYGISKEQLTILG